MNEFIAASNLEAVPLFEGLQRESPEDATAAKGLTESYGAGAPVARSTRAPRPSSEPRPSAPAIR